MTYQEKLSFIKENQNETEKAFYDLHPNLISVEFMEKKTIDNWYQEKLQIISLCN